MKLPFKTELNTQKKKKYYGLNSSTIAQLSIAIIAFNCAINPAVSGALDNQSPAPVRSSGYSSPAPVSSVGESWTPADGTPQGSISLGNDNFPNAPANVVKGDVPVITSTKPVGPRTKPYEVEAEIAAVDARLQVIPDSMEPSASERRQEVYSLEEIRNPKSNFYASRGMFIDEGGIRNSALNDAAKGVGVRAGFSYEAARINDALQKRYRGVLTSRFSFFPLMLGGGRVIPPVITEVNNQQERLGNNFLYLSIGSYEIVKPASLALREPDWRDYLLLPVNDPRPPEGIAAEGSKELEAWKKSVDAGWAEGKREARRTFIANLNRLIRDYTGMQRYHSLAKKGAITIPRVQSIKNNRRVDGDRMFVGEERLEIKVSAKFKR